MNVPPIAAIWAACSTVGILIAFCGGYVTAELKRHGKHR